MGFCPEDVVDARVAVVGDLIGFTSRGPVFLQGGGSDDDDANDGGNDDGDDGAGNNDGDDGDDGGSGRTFSQEELDRIVSERLKRESKKYADYDDLKKAAQKLREIEDSQKDEKTRLAEELEQLKSDRDSTSTKLTKLDVALENAPEGMKVPQIRKLAKRLSGSTREELEEDAKELFAEFATSGGDDRNGGGRGHRPREDLRPGASNHDDDDDDMSPKELADAVRKRQRGY